MSHVWIDTSAGVAGDMLLGALLDAGASLDAVRAAVGAVVGDAVAITVQPVTRAGMRASKAEVELRQQDPPHRTWTTVATMITEAGLPERVRQDAYEVFERLADAEGRVHGIPAADVHFHEVGALDSIADVVGVCAALHDLGVSTTSASAVALGSGTVRAAHGRIPVPVPAVAELAVGRRVSAGGEGELTTPTGMALVATLAAADEDLPAMIIDRTGVGAGTRDTPGRPNVTRVLLGRRTEAAPTSPAVLLEANVDDLDPRLWPGVLARLIEQGADDAWLVPIVMKKGRPAHVLTVLAAPERAEALRDTMITATSTLGVRRTAYAKYALPRRWVEVDLDGATVPVKIGEAAGLVRQVMPEFDAVAGLAAASEQPERAVLEAARAAAAVAGWVVGRPPPI